MPYRWMRKSQLQQNMTTFVQSAVFCSVLGLNPSVLEVERSASRANGQQRSDGGPHV